MTKMGRPPVTQQELDEMYAKLRPHLEGGLSLNKACQIENVTRTVVIKYMRSDESFNTKITTAQRYKSIKLGYITSNMLGAMADDLKTAIESKRSLKDVFDRSQLSFLRAVMVYDRSVHDEYGADEMTTPPDQDKLSFASPRNEREAELQLRVLNKHADYVRANKTIKSKQAQLDDNDS